jgi:hypothetical protein
LNPPIAVIQKFAVNGTQNKSIASVDNGIPATGAELQNVLH